MGKAKKQVPAKTKTSKKKTTKRKLAKNQPVAQVKRIYYQKYSKVWELDDLLKDWLMPDPDDHCQASCRFCNQKIRAHYTDLKSHAQTAKHLRNVPINAPSLNDPIGVRRKTREIEMATLVATHPPLLAAADQLGDILRRGFCDLGFKMGRAKCAALVKSVVAPHFRSSLSRDLHSAPFSLFLETPPVGDSPKKKLLCLCVRYYSVESRQVVSTFLGIVEARSANPKDVLSALMRILVDFSLDVRQLVAVAADGATFDGNSLFALLRQESVPDLALISCSCHSIEVVVRRCLEVLPTRVEYMIRRSHDWFGERRERLARHGKLFATVFGGLVDNGDGPDLSDRRLSGEEHLSSSLVNCAERILRNYEVLARHFADTGSSCHEAEVLAGLYGDQLHHAYLTFAGPILVELQRVNQMFRSETEHNMTSSYRCLGALFGDLCKRVVKPIVLRAANANAQLLDFRGDESVYLSADAVDFGQSFIEELDALQLDEDTKSDVLRQCFQFLKVVVTELAARLTEGGQLVAKLDSVAPSKFGKGDVPSLLDATLTASFFGCEEAELEKEVREVDSLDWVDCEDPVTFWTEVSRYRDATSGSCAFANLAGGVMKLLILPVADADIERIVARYQSIKYDEPDVAQLSWINSVLLIEEGLRRTKTKSSQFVPPKDLLRSYESRMFD